MANVLEFCLPSLMPLVMGYSCKEPHSVIMCFFFSSRCMMSAARQEPLNRLLTEHAPRSVLRAHIDQRTPYHPVALSHPNEAICSESNFIVSCRMDGSKRLKILWLLYVYLSVLRPRHRLRISRSMVLKKSMQQYQIALATESLCVKSVHQYTTDDKKNKQSIHNLQSSNTFPNDRIMNLQLYLIAHYMIHQLQEVVLAARKLAETEQQCIET
uniref:Uncharacterized protein n=1 Tax=Timema poppense TaxID=170557 RepID=A0A7R9CK11_TIMPO|nr:unnamed protein product [Timema poppensis]